MEDNEKPVPPCCYCEELNDEPMTLISDRPIHVECEKQLAREITRWKD